MHCQSGCVAERMRFRAERMRCRVDMLQSGAGGFMRNLTMGGHELELETHNLSHLYYINQVVKLQGLRTACDDYMCGVRLGSSAGYGSAGYVMGYIMKSWRSNY